MPLSKITIKNNKWAIFSVYRPPHNSNIDRFLGDLSLLLNKYLGKYDKIIIMGELNIDKKDKTNPNFDKFSGFCNIFSLSNLLKNYTSFTKTHKTCIDFNLKNKKKSFQLTKTTHLLISTFLRAQTTFSQPKKVV